MARQLDLWGEIAQLRLPRHAANDDAPPIDCPIRFQGQWHDAESGLHYNRFRYYGPEKMQYISPDPIGLSGAPGRRAMSMIRTAGSTRWGWKAARSRSATTRRRCRRRNSWRELQNILDWFK